MLVFVAVVGFIREVRCSLYYSFHTHTNTQYLSLSHTLCEQLARPRGRGDVEMLYCYSDKRCYLGHRMMKSQQCIMSLMLEDNDRKAFFKNVDQVNCNGVQ